MDVGGKLAGGDGANPLQQKPLVHVAVDADHVANRMGPSGLGSQLKVDKVHVVTQKHIGCL